MIDTPPDDIPYLHPDPIAVSLSAFSNSKAFSDYMSKMLKKPKTFSDVSGFEASAKNLSEKTEKPVTLADLSAENPFDAVLGFPGLESFIKERKSEFSFNRSPYKKTKDIYQTSEKPVTLEDLSAENPFDAVLGSPGLESFIKERKSEFSFNRSPYKKTKDIYQTSEKQNISRQYEPPIDTLQTKPTKTKDSKQPLLSKSHHVNFPDKIQIPVCNKLPPNQSFSVDATGYVIKDTEENKSVAGTVKNIGNNEAVITETYHVSTNKSFKNGLFTVKESLSIEGDQVEVKGTFAPNTTHVNCNQLNNQGTFAPNTAHVNCNQFNNQGTFLPETANVNCNQLDNKGTLWATIMDVSDSINNENGQIKTENLQANLQKFDNSGGQLLVNGKTGTTSLNASEIINEKDGKIIVNTSEFNLQSSIIRNQSGKIQHTGQGLLNLSTQSLVNNGGQVRSNGHLIDHNKASIHNSEDGILTSHQMTLSGELHNDGGSVQAEKLNAALTGALHNDGGKISITGEQDNSSIEATEIHNSNGAAISSNCNLTLKTRQLNSDDTGKLTSGKNLTLFLEDSLDNKSVITAKGKLAFYLPGDLNNRGKLAGGQGVFIGKDEQGNKCNSLNNSSGSIISGDGSDMEINAQSVINRKEIFKSVQRKSADPVTFQKEYRKKNKLYTQPVCTDYTTDCIEQDSQPGLMVAGRDLSINSNYVHNQFSHILSYGNININSNRLHNQGFIPKETKHTFIKEQRGYTDKGDECHPARIKEKFNKKACKLDWLPGSVKNSKRIADQSAVDLMPRFHCPKKKNYLVCDKTETYNVGDCEGSIKACGTTKINCKNEGCGEITQKCKPDEIKHLFEQSDNQYSLFNECAKIEGTTGVYCSLDGDFMNLSGTIQSGDGDVSICTSGDIISQTVAHTLNIDDTSEYFNTIVEPVTAIHGNNVLLESKNTQLTAAEITANNDITFHADKDLIFDSIPIYKRINDIDNKSSFSSESLRWKGNTIHAGGNISTQSGRDTIIKAGDITAGNNVNIKAQGNTQLLSKEGYCKTHTHEKKKKKEFFGSSKKESVDDYCDVTYARPHITAGKQLNIDAEKNVTLQSAVLTAEKVKAHAEDKLIIPSVTESHSESHSRSSKNALWQSSKEKGSIDEKVLLPEIYIEKPSENSKEQKNLKKNTLPDSIFSFFKPFVKSLKKFIPSYFLASENIELSANEGVHVQVKSHNQSLQDSIDLVQQQDGLQWIAQLRDNPDVEWEPIEEAHKHWKHKAQGLTPEAAALISIAAGIATCGIATEIEAAIGGIAGTMNSAGFTSLVGTASVSAINNQGDVGKVLQELGQSKNVKRIVNSMLTAGLLKQVDQYLPDAKHGADPGDRFKATLAKSFAHAGVSATMNTATIGGDFTDNLQDALKSNLLNQLHQQICTSIGNHFEFHQEDFNKTLTHALAGGVKAKLEGDEFATGALAAALAELSGDTLINHIDDEQCRKKIAGLISATATMLTGGDAKDIEHANEIAETVHQYNATFHANQAKALQEIIKDKTEEEKSRFLAAGFYLRRVINGVPEDDEYYEQLKALYDRGAECCEEQETLKRTELFDYSSLDAVADWCGRNDEAIHRATGLVKMIYGGTTAGTSVAGGLALSGASLGSAAVFTPLYAMGAKAGTEEVKEGFQQATEEFHSNKGKAVFDSFDNPQDFDWYSAAGRAAVEVILDVTTKQLGGTVVKAGIKQIDKAVDQTKKGAKNLSDTLKSGKKGDVLAREEASTSIDKIDKPSSVDSSSKNLYGPYNPKETRKDLEEIHGVKNVKSTTVVEKPNQRVNSDFTKGIEVIHGDCGGKAVRVKFKDLMTNESKMANIPYNNRGLPVFDNYVKYTTNIDRSKGYRGQFRQATRDLKDAIISGKMSSKEFTPTQLKNIQGCDEKIKGYTWHHNADTNNMQLLPTEIHDAAKHIGYESLSKGK